YHEKQADYVCGVTFAQAVDERAIRCKQQDQQRGLAAAQIEPASEQQCRCQACWLRVEGRGSSTWPKEAQISVKGLGEERALAGIGEHLRAVLQCRVERPHNDIIGTGGWQRHVRELRLQWALERQHALFCRSHEVCPPSGRVLKTCDCPLGV